jgi:molecular chaperone GrpE
MVNINNNDNEVQDDIEITNDDTDTTEHIDTELVEDEATDANKIKKLRTELKEADAKYRDLHEELQRNKADFLNARKRLEEERFRDRERVAFSHVEKLLPLCDSFHLAMMDEKALEAIDPKWRKGIEGIYSQMKGLMESYGVTAYDPTGQDFDPTRHEALSMVKVIDEAQNHKVITVIQQGYEQKRGDTTEIIRPARVTVGEID